MELVLGILAAFGASTLYSLGIALQALDAREASRERSRCALALLGGLVRRSRWLLGTGLSILGFPLQFVALLLAPLVVVQPALAAGLLVLLFVGERLLDERPGRYEYMCRHRDRARRRRRGAAAPPRSTAHSADALHDHARARRRSAWRACALHPARARPLAPLESR